MARIETTPCVARDRPDPTVAVRRAAATTERRLEARSPGAGTDDPADGRSDGGVETRERPLAGGSEPRVPDRP